MATSGDLLGLCLSVPAGQAERTIRLMADAGALDPRRAVTQDGDRVLIPVSDPEAPKAHLEADMYTLVERELGPNPRRPPRARALDRLTHDLPPGLLDALPSGWQMLGDVLLLRLPNVLEPHAARVGKVYGEELGARSVLALERAEGELREPRTRLLWGDANTETVHREHGIVFHLDPARVLFSPGNHHERHRLVGAVEEDETVVDLFAGVGYFTLPLARAGARVIACEKNPVSAAYLRRNVGANGLEDQVEIREGDAREVAPEAAAERVLMGYFPGTWRFLGCALRALGRDGGMVHYHTEVKEPDALETAGREFRSNLPANAPKARTLGARRVKSTGPGASHVVLDVEVER